MQPTEPSTEAPIGPKATAEALATLERSLAQAAGLAAENAALIQQQDNTAAQAALAASVERLLGRGGDA